MTGENPEIKDAYKHVHVHIPDVQNVHDAITDLTNEQDRLAEYVRGTNDYIRDFNDDIGRDTLEIWVRLDRIKRRQNGGMFFVHFYSALIFAYITWLNWSVVAEKFAALFNL